MNNTATAQPATGVPTPLLADWRDYFALLKPRVMTLVIFTAACAMVAAPGSLHPFLAFTGILCIAVAAGAAGALNQWYEADIDALMKRTAKRPLPAGKLQKPEALAFGVILGTGSVAIMGLALNWVAAAWLAVSILFYVVVYTAWLKRRTPQNIVIGGAAGAFPVICGWAAVAGETPLLAWILFAIIFLWTPPHFWALALYRVEDYRKSGLPMLPVTHGNEFTRLQILLYTLVLFASCLLPFIIGMSSWLYLVASLVFNGMFVAYGYKLWRQYSDELARRTFRFSLIHLSGLFAALLLDHYLL